METEELFIRRAVVFGSAVVYWAGVWIQARRVRHQIGRSPNVRPRSPKERWLWSGWMLVVVTWLALPFLAGRRPSLFGVELLPSLLHPFGLALGLFLVAAGIAGTWSCYAAMGDTWRMGVNRDEKTALVTRGPYRFVRHPIYVFQIVILAGVVMLLPTFLALLVLLVHLVCVLIKAADEEAYLLTVHGSEYRDYVFRTGRLFPKSRGKPQGNSPKFKA